MNLFNSVLEKFHEMKTNRALTFFILCLIFLLAGCESRKTIVNGLDEKEANEISVYLAARGFDVQKTKAEGAQGATGPQLFDITVKEADAVQTMFMLNQVGLPRRRGQNLLGIFQNTGLVPTEMTEKIRYQAGLAEQIASTIRKIDGVLDAEVQVSFPEEDPLNPGKTKGDITASVYVKHSGALDDPNAHSSTKIKRLVSAGITGLKYDNVTLILDKARYSEVPVGFISGEEQKQYVVIWSLILGKESVTRFRVIFFTLCLLLLFLTLLLVWIIWKVYPLLQGHGGLKELLHLKNIKSRELKSAQVKEEGAKVGKAVTENKTGSEADSGANFEGEIEFEDEEKK